MGKSVVKDWVSELPLRHQGVLLTCVRGCDTAPKHDASKKLARCFREVILNAFVGDPAKAQTFIEKVSDDELFARMKEFRKNCDHIPMHYTCHLMHGAEVVAYKHPDPVVRAAWRDFYYLMVHGLHLEPESEAAMDLRLTADEHAFGQQDRL